jgi:hypothetical protein
MTAQGFLPEHPVTLLIDGREIVTLHADGEGQVSYRIHPSALHLSRGHHVILLVSMLITSTDSFRSS